MKKAYLFMLLLWVLWICPVLTVWGEETSLSTYVVEMELNNHTWYYGDEALTVDVTAGEAVHTKIIGYYTKSQWNNITGGKREGTSLSYMLPDGVGFKNESSSVTSVLDGENVSIGKISVNQNRILIKIDPQYTELMGDNDNIEIVLEGALEFDVGQYDLGQQFHVTSKGGASSSARWNDYTLSMNKVDESDTAVMLDGAYFSLLTENDRGEEEQQIEIYGFEQNDTFKVLNNQIVTLDGKSSVLSGGFEPGNVYSLKEKKAPIGYCLAADPTRFAFYRYTDSGQLGTKRMIRSLNQVYKAKYQQYENIAVFGDESGESGGNGVIFIKNKRIMEIQIHKMDTDTKEAISNVTFVLQAKAGDMDYSAEEYTGLENAAWKYDSATDYLSWTKATDTEGRISFPERSIPYATNGIYTLLEYVPEGYAGSGYDRVLTSTFRLLPDGQLQVESGELDIRQNSQFIEITVWDKKALNLEIHKANQKGEMLKNAEFALYGPKELAEDENSDKKLSYDETLYYYMKSGITDENGILKFYDLPYDTYCLLETKAPEGYALLQSPYQVVLNGENAKGGIVTVTILNMVDFIMPDMGASPYIWMTCAIVFMAAGTGMLLEKKRGGRKCES